tara:strand:+ start:1073 stop:1423 length:351 start_codon:yes stop_codon:yes gene_type:complete
MFRYITILLFCAFSTLAFAEDNDWDNSKYDFRWMHVPVVCGTSEEVQRYIRDNDFKLVSVSIGREGASPDGNPAYWVSYFINEKGDQSIAAITSPQGNETCMMYRSFDLKTPGTQT